MSEFDVNGIEKVIEAVYSPTSSAADRAKAQEILAQFKEAPDSWFNVPTILEKAVNQETKYFALQVLDQVIQYRWKILPREQCDGMRAFIVNKIVQLSSNEQLLRANKLYLQKLNQTLVQILKQEWPNNWSSFIGDIVKSSSSNESLCENNMCILKLLSEEIFDFSRNQMTLAKTTMLKEQFQSEFTLIYQLCEYVLNNSQRIELLTVTLESFLGFISWIPPQYIFESSIINLLVGKFLPISKLRNTATSCLTEIVSLSNIGNYQKSLFAELLKIVLIQLNANMPPIKEKIVEYYAKSSSTDKTFIHNLALFFSSIFKNHLQVFEENVAYHPFLVQGHTYLACITYVGEEEVFKICLDYWSILAESLYHHSKSNNTSLQVVDPRNALYRDVLQSVRIALISNMPKPEEVFITEDENGEIVKEENVDTNNLILYKTMRDTLIFLTHLNPNETISIMKEKLTSQVNGTEYSWHNLNTLCWAVGSISGAQSEDEEKRFLVLVLKELLQMCESRKKDDKAVIASNIMYIVGQYPRFLNKHWSFLRTVVLKLFEFMHEKHPGIAEMACDTFLTISKACRHNFVMSHKEEPQPYIYQIIEKLDSHTSDLNPQLITVFYEAVAIMIASNQDHGSTQRLIFQLMSRPNAKWDEILNSAAQNRRFLYEIQIAKLLTNILKINVRTAVSLGNLYFCQLEKLFLNLLHVYRFYSEEISGSITAQGGQVAKHANIRSYRAVKREILRLLETFISNALDHNFVSQSIIPPLFSAILDDYQNNHPDARDPEVISLISVVIGQLKSTVSQEIPKIFACVIQPTVNMIQSNFEDFPDHRVNLFNLIRSINANCFQVFFLIPPDQFKLAIDSIVWAFKHTMRNIADTGLITLSELWANIERSDAANAFYKLYLVSLLNDLLSVLTDTLHKSGFKMQAALMRMIINTVQSGKVNVPLWDPATANYPNNQTFLGEFIVNLVTNGCKNLSRQQVLDFASGLFIHSQNPQNFNQHLRDFLVNMKEFAEADNSELFREEQELKEQQEKAIRSSVPGLEKPQV